MLLVYECICFCIIPAILMLHYLFLVLSDDSKHQLHKFRNSLTYVSSYITMLNVESKDGIRFHELKVIYKNREFLIGVVKKDHSYRYGTYSIFINGEEAGILHQIGDCCRSQYYFEKQNHRYQSEVMSIINAGAKKVKKERDNNTKKLVRETLTWDEHSYFK